MADVTTSIETSQKFGVDMLKALGIDTKLVVSFTIVCDAGAIPTATITRAIPKGAGESAALVASKYTLTPNGEEVNLGSVDESIDLTTLACTTHRLADSLGTDRT